MLKQEFPEVVRVRHPIVVRTLAVAAVEKLSPSYVRLRLTGSDLVGFVSAGFDDHIKVFFAEPGQELVNPAVSDTGITYPEGAVKPLTRDYTPRYYNAEEGYLEVDFVLHEEGQAGSWAKQAKVGSEITIAGPRGSMVIPMAYDWHLLIGDETALPAITRCLEELPASVKPVVVLELAEEQLAHYVPAHPQLQLHVVPRSEKGQALAQAVAALSLPEGMGYAWAAAESAVIKKVREVLVAGHQLDNKQIKASSYWRATTTAVDESN